MIKWTFFTLAQRDFLRHFRDHPRPVEEIARELKLSPNRVGRWLLTNAHFRFAMDLFQANLHASTDVALSLTTRELCQLARAQIAAGKVPKPHLLACLVKLSQRRRQNPLTEKLPDISRQVQAPVHPDVPKEEAERLLQVILGETDGDEMPAPNDAISEPPPSGSAQAES